MRSVPQDLGQLTGIELEDAFQNLLEVGHVTWGGVASPMDFKRSVGITMINHPFGNGLYQLSMVIWGMVCYCYTHSTSFAHTLICNCMELGSEGIHSVAQW